MVCNVFIDMTNKILSFSVRQHCMSTGNILTSRLEQLARLLGTQTVNEVTQLVDAAFADIFQVLTQTELYSILNVRVLADKQTPQKITLMA